MKKKEQQKLLESTFEIAQKLGSEFEQVLMNTLFTEHNPGYKRGRALTVADVKNLKVGDIVWLRYKKWDRKWRVDEAVTIVEIYSPGDLETDACSFRCTNSNDNEKAVDENHGYADLSVAVNKGEASK